MLCSRPYRHCCFRANCRFESSTSQRRSRGQHYKSSGERAGKCLRCFDRRTNYSEIEEPFGGPPGTVRAVAVRGHRATSRRALFMGSNRTECLRLFRICLEQFSIGRDKVSSCDEAEPLVNICSCG